jgi:hypothetical protein
MQLNWLYACMEAAAAEDALTMSVPCMQVDRRGKPCDCVVVGYDRRKAMHEVQWTAELVEGADNTKGRGAIQTDSVDFAEDFVRREIVRRQLVDKRG